MKDKSQKHVAEAVEKWPMVPLGEVIEKVSTGFATGKRDPKGVVQLRMNNVSTLGQFDWSTLTRVPESEIGNGNYLESGDVLFNNTNSTELVGKSALFLGHTEPVVYSNHFTRLRAKKGKLLPEYLALWLQKQWQNRVFADICNQWIGQSAVQPSKLITLLIPIPPVDEQQKIASDLQTQLTALDEARAAAEAQLMTLKMLPAALLRAAFNGTLGTEFNSPPPPSNIVIFRENQKWPHKTLGEICEINPRRLTSIELQADDLATFVPMPAVDEYSGSITRAELKPYREVRKGYTFFTEGDVLFAKITPCMQNGKHAVARNLKAGIGFGSTEFHVLRPGATVSADWIHFFLRQPSVMEEAATHFEGSVGQQRVPAAFLRQLVIPLPPVDEQTRLVAALHQQLDATEDARTATEAQLASLRKLPASLLRQAFEPAA